MSQLLAWLKGFNVSTHTIAAIAGALAAAYGGYKPFHDMVTSLYLRCPAEVQAAIGASIFLFGLYKSGALKGANSMDAKVYCPRCGKLGVVADSATEHLVYCPAAHGLIHKSPLPEQPAGVGTGSPELTGDLTKKRALN